MLIAANCMLLPACGNRNEQNINDIFAQIVEETVAIQRENMMQKNQEKLLRESNEQAARSYKEDAEEQMKNEWYDTVEAGFLTLDLPRWVRKYDFTTLDENSSGFQCYQSEKNMADNAVSITVQRVAYDTLENIAVKLKKTGYEMEEPEIFHDYKLGDTLFCSYRHHMAVPQSDIVFFYQSYAYMFYNKDGELITLMMDVPEKWDTDFSDMISAIYKSIVLPARHFPDNDFLSSEENINLFRQYKREGKYEQLYTVLQEYVSADDVQKNDSAYMILEVLEAIMPYLDSVSVKYDEIEGEGIIFYKGVENISSGIHIVLSADTRYGNLSLTVGFVKSDWLFFDHVIITGESGNYETSTSKQSIDNIVQKDGAIIRFENTHDEKQLDYPLSSQEISAMKTIMEFEDIGDKLSDILSEYQDYQDKHSSVNGL